MFNKKVDKILDKIIIVLIAILFLGTILVWFALPAKIPNHLDAVGNIKDYTSKNALFFISIIGSGLGFGALKLSQNPDMYNFAVSITDENREIQHTITTRMVRVLGIEFLLIFTYLEYCMIQAQKTKVIYIISLIITLVYYLIKSIRHK